MPSHTISAVVASKFGPLLSHADTRLALAETAVEQRFDMKYEKTYDFPGDFIDGYHQWLGIGAPRDEHGMLRLGIEGWLLPADALKLYEMAYFGDDILELGTFKGLSGTVMANAVFNSGRSSPIVTVDLDPVFSAEAKEGLEERHVPSRENVHFFVFEGAQFVNNLASSGRKFSFSFIDHSHVYEHVLEACRNLHRVIRSGGFCLFHDYNDPRNANPDDPNYGVYQGVEEGISKDHFEFFGVFGCTSLWLRNSAPD